MSSTVQSSLIEQLQKKCRFWKRVAVSALSLLILVIIFGYAYMHEQAVTYQAEIEELRGTSDETDQEPRNVMDEEIQRQFNPEKKQ
jgi:hypothetical protein